MATCALKRPFPEKAIACVRYTRPMRFSGALRWCLCRSRSSGSCRKCPFGNGDRVLALVKVCSQHAVGQYVCGVQNHIQEVRYRADACAGTCAKRHRIDQLKTLPMWRSFSGFQEPVHESAYLHCEMADRVGSDASDIGSSDARHRGTQGCSVSRVLGKCHVPSN